MHSSMSCIRGTTRRQADTAHCAYAFDVLIAHLTGLEAPLPDFEDGTCPLFVTWNKSSSSSGSSNGSSSSRPPQLRGCIGTLEPRKLHTALKDYSLTSALRDSRFPPVQLREVQQLSCAVSLLCCFEAADGWRDWEVGRHGLIIEFTDPVLQCKRTATFLPEVAGDQGWSQRQCIESLIRKAGYSGTPTQQLLDGLKITRYQSSKAALTFADYSSRCSSRLEVADLAALLSSAAAANGGSSGKSGRLRLACTRN